MNAKKLPPSVTLFCFLLSGFCLLINPTAIAVKRSGDAARQSPVQPDLIKVVVTVTDDNGNVIQGLDQNNFSLSSDQGKHDISYFGAQDEPVGLLLLIDTSKSMSTKKTSINRFTDVKPAFANFLKLSNENNEFALMSFNESGRLIADWTHDKDSILKKLDEMSAEPPSGKTLLYSSLGHAIDAFAKCKYPKRAIVMVSDGEDTLSTSKDKKILKQKLRENEILVYPINVGDRDAQVWPPQYEARRILDDIATTSGGIQLYAPGPAHVNLAFERLAFLLRNQYVIGFKPMTPTPTNKYRKLKVGVRMPPDAPKRLKYPIVIHREGYLEGASTK
jgi:VWFA-related protein